MILDVFAGANIYVGKNEYPNPPVMAILLRPFAELPPVVGAMAWFYAKVLMAVLAAVWTFRLVGGQPQRAPSPVGGRGETQRPPPPPLGGGVGGGVQGRRRVSSRLPAIIGDLSHNNVNIFILFLVAACLELYRRRRDFGAGLVLGLAIACKVTPLLFLAYFIWKRAVAGVGGRRLVGLVLWLAVVPGLVFGWDRNARTLHRLVSPHDRAAGPEGRDHHRAPESGRYRVSCIAYSRTARRSSTTRRRRRATFPSPAAFHNLTDIGRPAAWVVVKVLTAGFALAVVLLCRAAANRTRRAGASRPSAGSSCSACCSSASGPGSTTRSCC